MKNLFHELCQILELLNAPIISLLQPGISQSHINSHLENNFISLPSEVYELYEWKNGISEQALENKAMGEISLFSLGIFIPFEIALAEYISYVQADYWNKNLFPLFGSGGGDYYLIDCDKNSNTFGMIYFYSPTDVDFDGIITKFDSLNSLIKTVTECYHKGVYTFDEHFFLDSDFKTEQSISKENNPKSNYWRIFN